MLIERMDPSPKCHAPYDLFSLVLTKRRRVRDVLFIRFKQSMPCDNSDSYVSTTQDY